jgi:hypothetical protein
MTTLAALLALAPLSLAAPRQDQAFVRPAHAVYLDRTSVVAGEPIAVHARSDSEKATIDVVTWRGGRRLVKPREVEIAPQHDLNDEAGNGCRWSACATLAIPADAASDVYLVRVRSERGELATAPLVVRAARPGAHSRALVLYPEATLAAYNQWGGASLYPTRFGPPSTRVSLDRPLFGDQLMGQVSGVFLDWLAETGFAVEHASDLDLDRDSALLNPYDLIVFPHHHEYWTGEMRRAVDAFVENGGRALILGGNFCYLQVRLERDGRAIFCTKIPELDPYYRAPELASAVTTAFALGPVLDPPDASFGLAFRHAGWATPPMPSSGAIPDEYGGRSYHYPRQDGFGYLRAHVPEHPFLAGSVPVTAIFGRLSVEDHALVTVGGECDGANLELQDGHVLASRASGAPVNLRILATAPAQYGFAAVAEHHRFGSVAHFGSSETAHGPMGDMKAVRVPETLAMLARALAEYGRPRRSLVKNGGFERWRMTGDRWSPLEFESNAEVERLALPGRGYALAGGGSGGAVWQEIALPKGIIHLVGRVGSPAADLRLDVGAGFRLIEAARVQGMGSWKSDYRYGRVLLEQDRKAYLTLELHGGMDGGFDDVEVIPDAAWHRELALDLGVPALAAHTQVERVTDVLDGGSLYLLTLSGTGRGTVMVSGRSGPLALLSRPDRQAGVSAMLVDPGRPGESIALAVVLKAITPMQDVAVGLLPLHRPSRAALRAEPMRFAKRGEWRVAGDAPWVLSDGIADAAVRLTDQAIAMTLAEQGEIFAGRGRLTLWTRGTGTLEIRLVGAGWSLVEHSTPGDPFRWKPVAVSFEGPLDSDQYGFRLAGRISGEIRLSARGEVDVDALRIEPLRASNRDDRVPNGAFEMVPFPAEAMIESTDWHDRPPGWSIEDGSLLLDPDEPNDGDYSLRVKAEGGFATARRRIPDAMPLDRAWRATLAARCGAGAQGTVTLHASWPGGEPRIELARGELREREWTDVALGATVADLARAMDALRVPYRRPGATALAWIEVRVSGGSVWIDDLTLDAD